MYQLRWFIKIWLFSVVFKIEKTLLAMKYLIYFIRERARNSEKLYFTKNEAKTSKEAEIINLEIFF